MLQISLITVIYKRIGKFWYITQSELNSSAAVNGDIFIKNLQGVPLHLNTYTCKYQTATYLMRFFGVDFA